MELTALLQKEMENEAATTRKMLSRVPPEKFNWQPHPKSMTLKRLATHIAELPGWIAITLTTNELDLDATPHTPKEITNTGELLDFFEESLKGGREALARATAADFDKHWVMRRRDTVNKRTKYEVIRMAYSQIVHHRAQLGVYLRLLDIAIPGSYGPSADEPAS